jgi:hypothetical protein
VNSTVSFLLIVLWARHLTLSVLGHMAAIVLRPFSGNFTRAETHAVNNSEVLSYFFHLHSINN